MSEELDYLKNRDLNISYDSEAVIQALEDELLVTPKNEEINVYYKVIDLNTDIAIPFNPDHVEFADNEYPIYVDYLTKEEIQEYGIDDDLKKLNMVKMKLCDALELFRYQDRIIKIDETYED